ncbi:MAG: hypothetical protein CMO81_07900 [Waddliaceae bacterium]|nr:hypothetical protein [Waddliaceae bacterium]
MKSEIRNLSYPYIQRILGYDQSEKQQINIFKTKYQDLLVNILEEYEKLLDSQGTYRIEDLQSRISWRSNQASVHPQTCINNIWACARSYKNWWDGSPAGELINDVSDDIRLKISEVKEKQEKLDLQLKNLWRITNGEKKENWQNELEKVPSYTIGIHNFQGKNALHLAVLADDHSLLRKLIHLADPKDLLIETEEQESLLDLAIHHGFTETVQMLCEHDQPFLSHLRERNHNPLKLASSFDHKEILTILLKSLSPEQLNEFTQDALYTSVYKNHFDCVALLIRYMNKEQVIQTKNSFGESVFRILVTKCSAEMLQLFLEKNEECQEKALHYVSTELEKTKGSPTLEEVAKRFSWTEEDFIEGLEYESEEWYDDELEDELSPEEIMKRKKSKEVFDFVIQKLDDNGKTFPTFFFPGSTAKAWYQEQKERQCLLTCLSLLENQND